MLRIGLTGDWRHGDAALGGDRAATAVELAHGVLALELDGVDITGGRAEGPLLPALEALLRAVAHLVSGGRRGAVSFRDGAVQLLLRRRGAEALLSLALLERPARLAAGEVAVDLGALAAAALEASAELCAELGRDGRAGRRAGAAARQLRLATTRAERPGPTDGGQAREAPPLPPPPTCPGQAGSLQLDLLLDDEEALALDPAEPADLGALLAVGRLRLDTSDGVRLLDLAGLPILALRDLAAGVEDSARALRRGDRSVVLRLGGIGRASAALTLDLQAGTLARDGGGEPVRASALDLAGAVLAAAGALAERATGRSERHASNPALLQLLAEAAAARDHLADLLAGDQRLGVLPSPPRAEAATGPSQAPLAAGRLRRVTLRRTAEAHVGEPIGPGLVAAGRIAVAAGRDALLALEPATGRVAWRAAGAEQLLAAAAGLLLLRRGDTLEALELRSGILRWRHPLLGDRPTSAAASPRGPVLLAGPGALTALDPRSGHATWRRPLPGASGLWLSALGSLAAVASDAGVVHGVGQDGALAWRVRGPGPALAAPRLVCGLLASLHAAGPAAVLLLVDPVSGERRGEVPLDVRPVGAPLPFAGGLVVGGLAGGEAVLIHLVPGRGRRWEVGAPLAGPPLLAAGGDRLLAADAAGALAALDRQGRLAWSLPPAAEGGAAPWLVRGVAVAARDGLALLDAASGRTLAHAALPAPARLAATPELALTALDAGGTVTTWATTGHVSVVG